MNDWKRRKNRKYRNICTGIALAAVLVLFMPSYTVLADVYTVEDPFGQQGSVYVAGNPDLYPLEYYDPDTDSYEGIMPEILKRVSDRTGVDFVYIKGGRRDQRAGLAENNQVELVSGCIPAEDDFGYGVDFGSVVFTVTADGKAVQAAFGYTQAATEELREVLEEEIKAVRSAEGVDLAVSVMYREGRKNRYPLWLILAAAGGMILFLSVSAAWVIWAGGQRERNLDRMYLDEVTGAGNRTYFKKRFSELITGQVRPLYFVFYIGFDIRQVNNHYGEEEAEKLLRYEADMLDSMLKEGDFFARVSGGDYAAAVQCVTGEKAKELSEELLRQLNAYCKKTFSGYIPVFNAGIYQVKKGDSFGEDVLYAARKGYQEAVKTSVPYMVCDAALLRRKEEQGELRKQCLNAVRNREFVCSVQFIKDAVAGNLAAAEVLSRWQHPEKGLLMPEKYIADMEKTGAVVELDFYMFEETCRLLQQFGEEGFPEFALFCNISKKTLSLPDFVIRLQDIAIRYPIRRDNLCLEITESGMACDRGRVMENIRACKEMGFLLALDDVGKGSVPFADLHEYPVDIVKFDRDMLLATEKPGGKRLLKGMNALFHSLRITTLCEGVETKEQYQLLEKMGIDYVQGFYIQRSLPVKEGINWLKRQKQLVKKKIV